jgi:hypothetical protein
MRQESQDYYAGRLNGDLNAKAEFIYFLFGLLLGVFAILITAFYQQKVSLKYFNDKSDEYRLGFIESYRSCSRSKNVILSIVGCLFHFIILGIIYGLIFARSAKPLY